MTSAISVTDAAKIYGVGDAAVTALAGVTASFEQGKFTAIMGPSGSGKSTLLHCLAGLDSLDRGDVILGDIELGALSDKDLTLVRREQIGFIFQAFNLIPTLTAKENILLPLSIAGDTADPVWYDQVVKAVGLEDRLGHRPSELSGGQQQRVAAARALVSKPAIVFADEPSGNLDSKSGEELLDFMRKAVDDFGQTIVMVTHDAFAASYADRVIFLDDGQIVAELLDPTSEQILDKMKELGD
ncbi:MAG: ABC transporter ATP-binding protein [Armatimonadetes bacterium]|nr:MAG: ABC transporter ATP-binding protein [Armatimonadota bacterium]